MGSNLVAEEIQAASGTFISGMLQAGTTTVHLRVVKSPVWKTGDLKKRWMYSRLEYNPLGLEQLVPKELLCLSVWATSACDLNVF